MRRSPRSDAPRRARRTFLVSALPVSLAVALSGALVGCAPAPRPPQEKTMVTLGTATPGGGFPVYGEAYSKALNAADPTLAIQPTNTKGSTENVPMLEAGKLDIGQVTGEVTYEAIEGIGRPRADVRIVNAMYSQPGLFMVRADSPVKTIADLKGKTIAWGAKGSGFIVLARYAMDGLGLDMARDFKSVYLDRAGDGPAMLLDGRVDALWGGGTGWPGFVAILQSAPGGRFVAPTSDEIARITAKHPFIKPMTLQPGSYPGQSTPIPSVGSWAFVLARPTLPDDVAYRLARAVHRSEQTFATGLAQMRETTLANTLAAAPRRELIHPGVMRYMREIGFAK